MGHEWDQGGAVCRTGRRKEGSPYVWCDDDLTPEERRVVERMTEAPGRGQPQPRSSDPCGHLPNGLPRFVCTERNTFQRARERLESRYHEPPDLSRLPEGGWQEIDLNMGTTKKGGYIAWVGRVSPGGDWDYKALDEKKRPNLPGVSLERLGNINYGATCVVAGNSPETCMRAAGLVQGYTDVTRRGQWFPDSQGRPWDIASPDGCYGDPEADDCQDVLEGIRYGMQFLRER